MRVPADWRLEQFVSASREDQTPFKLSIPGTAETCLLTVLDHCCQANPRGGPAWIERFERKGGTWQLWGEPLPHLFAPEDGPWPGWGRVAVFVRASGRTFQVDLVAPTECLATAGADLLAAAATLTTTASEWPPIPKDYGLVRAGDYRLAVHPSVTDPPQPFATAISDAQKICDRLYGRLPSPAPGEQTPVVYLHSERAQQEAVLPSLKDLTTPHSLCLSGLCIFAMSNEPRGRTPRSTWCTRSASSTRSGGGARHFRTGYGWASASSSGTSTRPGGISRSSPQRGSDGETG